MNANKIICKNNEVTYGQIRQSMAEGAFTPEEVKAKVNVCLQEDCCKSEVDTILTMICFCKKVPKAKIVDTIKKGVTSVDKISQYTEAGTGCGRCKPIISKLIELNK